MTTWEAASKEEGFWRGESEESLAPQLCQTVTAVFRGVRLETTLVELFSRGSTTRSRRVHACPPGRGAAHLSVCGLPYCSAVNSIEPRPAGSARGGIPRAAATGTSNLGYSVVRQVRSWILPARRFSFPFPHPPPSPQIDVPRSSRSWPAGVDRPRAPSRLSGAESQTLPATQSCHGHPWAVFRTFSVGCAPPPTTATDAGKHTLLGRGREVCCG